ncbi:hypothetical protein TNCV_2356001 [Trichonephila clavipes]|nr:hypothetical protein TNCV_2356001 [Trichonephila clavipes]
MNLIILYHGQVTRTIPELASISPSSLAIPTGGHLSQRTDLTYIISPTRQVFRGTKARPHYTSATSQETMTIKLLRLPIG